MGPRNLKLSKFNSRLGESRSPALWLVSIIPILDDLTPFYILVNGVVSFIMFFQPGLTDLCVWLLNPRVRGLRSPHELGVLKRCPAGDLRLKLCLTHPHPRHPHPTREVSEWSPVLSRSLGRHSAVVSFPGSPSASASPHSTENFLLQTSWVHHPFPHTNEISDLRTFWWGKIKYLIGVRNQAWKTAASLETQILRTPKSVLCGSRETDLRVKSYHSLKSSKRMIG